MSRAFLIKLVTFLGGVFFFLEFFLPKEIYGFKLSDYNDPFSMGLRIMGSVAIGLGLINILIIHLPNIFFRKKDYFNSLALLAGFFLMLIVTSWDWYQKSIDLAPANHYVMLSSFSNDIASKLDDDMELQEKRFALLQESFKEKLPDWTGVELELSKASNEVNEEAVNNLIVETKSLQNNLETKLKTLELSQTELSSLSLSLSKFSGLYRQILSELNRYTNSAQLNKLMFEGFFMALGSAMFSLLGFYVASAAYRAFRIRSLESAVMMTAAFIVILGQIPFGIWLWGGFPDLRLWLLQVPNSAVFRGIALGAGVASLIMATRMWLSLENSSWISGDENNSKSSKGKGGSK